MIERVAGQIEKVLGDDNWPMDYGEKMKAIARAAIEAMREPPNMHEGWGDGLNADYRLIWQAMIAAALSEDEAALSDDMTGERKF